MYLVQPLPQSTCEDLVSREVRVHVRQMHLQEVQIVHETYPGIPCVLLRVVFDNEHLVAPGGDQQLLVPVVVGVPGVHAPGQMAVGLLDGLRGEVSPIGLHRGVFVTLLCQSRVRWKEWEGK